MEVEVAPVSYTDKVVLRRLMEFYVYAARALFRLFPGSWEVRQLEANTVGSAFWRSAIPVPFDEDVRDGRPVQHFTIEG